MAVTFSKQPVSIANAGMSAGIVHFFYFSFHINFSNGQIKIIFSVMCFQWQQMTTGQREAITATHAHTLCVSAHNFFHFSQKQHAKTEFTRVSSNQQKSMRSVLQSMDWWRTRWHSNIPDAPYHVTDSRRDLLVWRVNRSAVSWNLGQSKTLWCRPAHLLFGLVGDVWLVICQYLKYGTSEKKKVFPCLGKLHLDHYSL